MADIFRDPLLVGQRGRTPVNRIVAVPQSTPKTLIADVSAPPGQSMFLAPQRPRRLGADTSADTPTVLLSAPTALPPGLAVIVAAPSIKRLGTPISWRVNGEPVPTPSILPPGAQSFLAPPKLKWLQVEESAGTPKTFIDDDQIPVVNAYIEASPIHQRRLGADTSEGSPNTLVAPSVPPPPIVNPPIVVVDRRHWLPTDTAKSLALTFVPGSPQPFNTAPMLVIARRPAVTNTTKGVLPALYPPPPPPAPGVPSPSGDNKKLRAKLHRGRNRR